MLSSEVEKFPKDKNRKDGHKARCKLCYKRYYQENKEEMLAKRREYNHIHKKRLMNNIYLKTYGLTLEQYDQMFENQQGRCIICNEKETVTGRWETIKRLAVDHNHKTGKVRGLLCGSCNLLLGAVEDKSELINKMLEYLKNAR